MTIQIRGLTHIYPAPTEPVVALAGLDLDLPAGSITVVRGPNGSGKSTLVAILRGEMQPSAGHILHTGGQAPVIATIAQFGNVVADLTAAEHLDLFAQHHQRANTTRTPAGRLSRAAQQQLAAELAGTTRPGLMLADEPAASLAHADAVALYSQLAEQCRRSGATLLLVTHDYRAEAVADRVVRLRDGRISEEWEPGAHERQAIDARGWLRLPDAVRARFTQSVTVVNGDIVELADAAAPDSTPPLKAAAQRMAFGAGVVLDAITMYDGMRPISAQCPQGFITHLLGPAGSGTSALLRAIAGVQTPMGGSITWSDGLNDAVSRPVLASSELSLGGRQSLADMMVADEVLTSLGLRDLRDRALDTLSGGQRQRALIAIALSRPAQLVAIDEPTVNLDPQWRDTCMAALRTHAESGRVIVLATHDDDTVDSSDHVITLGVAGS